MTELLAWDGLGACAGLLDVPLVPGQRLAGVQRRAARQTRAPGSWAAGAMWSSAWRVGARQRRAQPGRQNDPDQLGDFAAVRGITPSRVDKALHPADGLVGDRVRRRRLRLHLPPAVDDRPSTG